jgi:hypothetical protein
LKTLETLRELKQQGKLDIWRQHLSASRLKDLPLEEIAE